MTTPIPTTLAERRAELLEAISEGECNAVGYEQRALECWRDVSVAKAELQGIDRAVAAYAPAEQPAGPAAAPDKPQRADRRDIRTLVREAVWQSGLAGISLGDLARGLKITLVRAKAAVDYGQAQGKLVVLPDGLVRHVDYASEAAE